MKTTTAMMTANPELWRDVYWGRFDTAKNSDTITPAIYRNRDTLALAYGLKPTRAAIPADLWRLERYPAVETDHPEIYRTKDGGLLLIVSNYGGSPHPALGMVEVAPVYSDSCKTYARVFDSPKHFRHTIKQAVAGTQKEASI